MPNSLVSIVIPLFNKEEWVTRTLLSVYSQTYWHWECLIIDDGSTDNSATVVQDFINHHPGNWSIITKINEGPSAARNLGIHYSKGEYLAFLDADDIWLPEKLARHVKFMDLNQDVNLSMTNYVIFDTKEEKQLRGVRTRSVENLLLKWLDMRGFGGLVESTGMLRAKNFHATILFDPTLRTTEGLDFVFNWHRRGKVSILKEFLTLYRISPGQLHQKEDLVRQSSRLVAERHSGTFSRSRLAQEFQRAYFYLSNLRGKGRWDILKGFLMAFSALDFRVFHMALSLIFRNIWANVIQNATIILNTIQVTVR